MSSAWIEDTSCNRDGNNVVDECPQKVDTDTSHNSSRYIVHCQEIPQVVANQDNTCSFHGDISGRSNGDTIKSVRQYI